MGLRSYRIQKAAFDFTIGRFLLYWVFDFKYVALVY